MLFFVFVFSRSSHRRCSIRTGILENFTKFTGKHLCQSLRPATLLKKRLWHRCFPLNFEKFLRKGFLQNTSGRLLLQNHDLLFFVQKCHHHFPGAAVRRCSVKKVFSEISQNSHENTCARVSLLIELQAEACSFIKKRL